MADKGNSAQDSFYRRLLNRESEVSPLIGPIIALVLFLWDLLSRFPGLPVSIIRKNIGTLLSESLNVSFIIISLLLYYFFKKRTTEEEDPKEFWRKFVAFVILIVVLSFIITHGGLAYYLHLGLIIVLYFVFIIRAEKDESTANLITAFLLLFDFIGFGLFDFYMGGALTINRLIVPIWFYYSIILSRRVKQNALISFILIVVIMVNVAYFASGIVTINTLAEYGYQQAPPEEIQNFKDFWSKGIGNIYTDAQKILFQIGCSASINPSQCMADKEIQLLKDNRCGKLTGDEKVSCEKQIEAESVGGIVTEQVDKEIDPIKASFEKKLSYPKIPEGFATPITLPFKIEDKRKLPIDAAFSCKFKKDKEEIIGIIIPESMNSIASDQTIVLYCSLPSDKSYTKGSYTVEFSAELKNIKTPSRLKRVFIGNRELSDSEKNNILTDHDLKSVEASRGPEDFASLSLGFGIPPSTVSGFNVYTTPLLGANDFQPLIAYIQNKGEGHITGIIEAVIDISQLEGFVPAQSCLEKFDFNKGRLTAKKEQLNNLKGLDKFKKGEDIFLLSCNLDASLDNLKFTSIEEERELISSITYSYVLKQPIQFEVIGSIQP